MPSSNNNTHTSGDVSSFDSDNPRSSADCEGSSNLERDRAAAITLPVRTRRNAPRKPTHQPKGVYEVTEIDLKSWAPTKPDKARTRFRSVCVHLLAGQGSTLICRGCGRLTQKHGEGWSGRSWITSTF